MGQNTAPSNSSAITLRSTTSQNSTKTQSSEGEIR